MPFSGNDRDFLGGTARLVIRLLYECIVEWLMMGTGRFLIRLVRPRSDPGEFACGIVGLAFWSITGLAAYFGIT